MTSEATASQTATAGAFDPGKPEEVTKGWTGRKCPVCKGKGGGGDDFDGPCRACGGTGDEYGPLDAPPRPAPERDATARVEDDAAFVGRVLRYTTYLSVTPHGSDVPRFAALARRGAQADAEPVAYLWAWRKQDGSLTRWQVAHEAFTAEEIAEDRLEKLPVYASPPPQSPAPDDGWRDIASAPKDGKAVLLWHNRIGYEGANVGNWNGICWYTGFGDAGGLLGEPTHWRPLPPPPVSPQRKDGSWLGETASEQLQSDLCARLNTALCEVAEVARKTPAQVIDDMRSAIKAGRDALNRASATPQSAGAALSRDRVPQVPCPHCGQQWHARVDEKKANGRYAPGPDLRCVNCKTVFHDPEQSAGAATGAGDAEVSEAEIGELQKAIYASHHIWMTREQARAALLAASRVRADSVAAVVAAMAFALDEIEDDVESVTFLHMWRRGDDLSAWPQFTARSAAQKEGDAS